MLQGVHRALDGAEALRHRFWRLGARTSLGRAALRDRTTRLSLLAAFHVSVALALTAVAPTWLLLLGPLVLGVPHVVADVRYLLLRPRWRPNATALALIVVPLAGMTALRLTAMAGVSPLPRAELACGVAAVLGAIAGGRGPAPRRALLALTTLALGALAMTSPRDAALVVGHAHNLVAIGLWLAWMRPHAGDRRVLGALVLYGAAALLILSGAISPLSSAPAAGLSLPQMTATLAPDLPQPWATRLVLLFAFAQAIHYSAWLRLSPQSPQHMPRPAPPTLRRAWRELTSDLGRTAVTLAVIGTLAVPVVALCWDAEATRRGYLGAVLFHGWLELAVVAWLLSRR